VGLQPTNSSDFRDWNLESWKRDLIELGSPQAILTCDSWGLNSESWTLNWARAPWARMWVLGLEIWNLRSLCPRWLQNGVWKLNLLLEMWVLAEFIQDPGPLLGLEAWNLLASWILLGWIWDVLGWNGEVFLGWGCRILPWLIELAISPNYLSTSISKHASAAYLVFGFCLLRGLQN